MLLRTEHYGEYEIDEEFHLYVKKDFIGKGYTLYLKPRSSAFGIHYLLATSSNEDTLYIIASAITDKYMNDYPYVDIREEKFWIKKRGWSLRNEQIY